MLESMDTHPRQLIKMAQLGLEEEIEETPTFGAKLETEYILGMAKMEGVAATARWYKINGII